MASLMQYQGRTLEIHVDRIEVTTQLPQPDPAWTYSDHHGHAHAYGTEKVPYPTLVQRHEPYWCADCQDEHTDTWLECPLCGEKITPGTYVDTSPRYIAGPTSYLIDGRSASPEEGGALFAQICEAHEQQQHQDALEAAQARAQQAVQPMRDEGLTEDQIERVVNRMVHGAPEGEQP